MSDLCANAITRPKHELEPGGRRLDIAFAINWGDDDERGDHQKPLSFCTFRCLADWAADRARAHDDSILQAV